MHIHLGGGQSHALGVIHGGVHVLDQLANAVIDLGDRLGDGVQAGVGIAKNGQNGHGVVGVCRYFRHFSAWAQRDDAISVALSWPCTQNLC